MRVSENISRTGKYDMHNTNLSELELPSNRKFGLFFVSVFALVAAYFYYSVNLNWMFVFIALASLLLMVTLIKSEVLLPLNRAWMRLGFFLAVIVSPVIISIIFLGLFTPVAVIMRLRGRDELRLKLMHRESHWIYRNEPITSESFKYQF